MKLESFSLMLAQAASGTSQGATQPNPMGQSIQFMVTIGILIGIFYFMMIRPQSKKAREQAEMLKSMKPGDKVITSSGIIATVVSVKDKSVAIRSAETKIEVLKSSITDITERSGESSATAES